MAVEEKMSDNGGKLSEMSKRDNLTLLNTFFKHSITHMTTWTSPKQPITPRRNIYRNQIDICIATNDRRGRFQRLPPARGGTAQRKIFHLANWSQHIHPGPSSSRSRFFMESSQLYAATLTHFSTEPLTTGPDYDPLLLLLALAGDVHPNPGPSTYPCSVCFRNVTSQGSSYLCTRCSHWVHSRCSSLRNAADYRKANGWICTACMTPPQPHAPSPPPSPAHTPTMSDKTFNILQWNANGIGNKQTELSIFLEAHDIKVAAIQESKLTVQSRSPNIQNYTLVRQDRRQGPGGGLLFFLFITESALLASLCQQRRRMTPT